MSFQASENHKRRKTRTSTFRKARRQRHFELLEARHLLAADPTLLFDLNSSPPSQGSEPIAWAAPPFSSSSTHFFLAAVNDQVQWWSTDGTNGGTRLIESVENPSHQRTLFQWNENGGFNYLGGMHESALGVTKIEWARESGLHGSVQIPFESRYLGNAGGNVFVQSLAGNAIYRVNPFTSETNFVLAVEGAATPILQYFNSVTILVANAQSGQNQPWNFYSQNYLGFSFFNARTPGLVDPTVKYFADDSTVWVAGADGSIAKTSDAFDVMVPLANLAAQPSDIERIFEFEYASRFDPLTNTSVVELLSPSRQIAVLNGRAQLAEVGYRLLVQVEGGSDVGAWWLNPTLDGFTKDTKLSTMTAIHDAGSAILGWANVTDFGTELVSYAPDPQILLGNQILVENQTPGTFLASFFLPPHLGSAVIYELVAGAGDTDNHHFYVNSNGSSQLIANDVIDFERQASAQIRVRATGEFGSIETAFRFFVIDLSESVTISNSTVSEPAAVGTVVGTLGTLNFVPGVPVDYSIVAVNNNFTSFGPFQIVGNELRLVGPLDFERERFYQVKVRAIASEGSSTESVVQITVLNANENELSQLVISNDAVLENLASATIGSLGVRNQNSSFTYSFVPGIGDYDNGRFQISGGTLTLVDPADYEFQSSFSIRILASNGVQQFEDFLTIDVLPVDEFPSQGIDFANLHSSNQGGLGIPENIPVGTVFCTLVAVDSDLGETYVYSATGSLMEYLRLDGDKLIIDKPINFELIPNVYELEVTFTATTVSSGNSVSATLRREPGTFGLPLLRDINDPPVLIDFANQTVRETEEVDLSLGNPLATDEDFNSFVYVTMTVNGQTPPDWIVVLDQPEFGKLRVNPPLGAAGNYVIEYTADDSNGGVDRGSFTLTILPNNLPQVFGTNGNDTVLVQPVGNTWSVFVNGARRLQNATTGFNIDGLGGNDTLIVNGRIGPNQFRIDSNIVRIDGFRVISNRVESYELSGVQGADTFLFESGFTANQRIANPPRYSVDGGSGNDTLSSIAGTNAWRITGNDSGSFNQVSFQKVENLIGGYSDDSFLIERNGSLSGTIDGGDGNDQIIYGERSGRVTAMLNSAVEKSGSSTRLGGFKQIDRISAPAKTDNRLSATSAAYDLAGGTATWMIGNGEIILMSSVVFEGFYDLRGGLSSDQFHFDSPSPLEFQIAGGGGDNFMYYLNYPSAVSVDLNLSKSSGVSQFSGVQYFAGNPAYGGKIIGPNSDVVWGLNGVSTEIQSNAGYVQAFYMNEILAGSRDDTFKVNANSVNEFVVDAGGGRNSLDYSESSVGVLVNLTAGIDSTGVRFSMVRDVYGTSWDDILIGNGSDNLLVGFSGSDTLQGLGGNDVLLGGNGFDVLDGGAGSDWLVGGSLSDQLNGGTGEDILFGGLAVGFETEEHDFVVASRQLIRVDRIDAVMSEWGSNRSYQSKISRLTGPGNGKLNGSTLSDDQGFEDKIAGGSGLDWFWVGINDLLLDREASERRNAIL